MLDPRGTGDHERVQTRLEVRVRILSRRYDVHDDAHALAAEPEEAYQDLSPVGADERAHDDPEAATARAPRRIIRWRTRACPRSRPDPTSTSCWISIATTSGRCRPPTSAGSTRSWRTTSCAAIPTARSSTGRASSDRR